MGAEYMGNNNLCVLETLNWPSLPVVFHFDKLHLIDNLICY